MFGPGNCEHNIAYLKKCNRERLDPNQEPKDRIIRFKRSNNPIDQDIPPTLPTEVSCNWMRLAVPCDLQLIKDRKGAYILVYNCRKDK